MLTVKRPAHGVKPKYLELLVGRVRARRHRGRRCRDVGHGVIVAAFDEGPDIGLGHRRRVECLQHELAAGESRSSYALDPLGADRVEGDVVLVDSYRVRADDTAVVRGRLVIAIDDIERDLAVDLVSIRGPGADAAHARLRAAACSPAPTTPSSTPGCDRMLAVAPRRTSWQRVLVATGASDSGAIGAASGVRARPDPARREVQLVVGGHGVAARRRRARRGRRRTGRAHGRARRGRSRRHRGRRHDARGVLPRPADGRVLHRRQPGSPRSPARRPRAPCSRPTAPRRLPLRLGSPTTTMHASGVWPPRRRH